MKHQKKNRKWDWVFWGFYFLINHYFFSPTLFEWKGVLITLIFVVHNAGTAYVVLDKWIPTYFQKKKYGWFLLASLLTITVFSILHIASLLAFFRFTDIPMVDISEIKQSIIGPAFLSNFSGLTALAIPYFVQQRIHLERRNRQLEKEKLAAELQNLKSQLHPHFLFNALNNIYFLIKKDPEVAAAALAGFSNLLRFQLYEAKNNYVSLAQEIAYLQQYAEIAQLRKGADFRVTWQLPQNIPAIQIPPLLLMPLVENAFKHNESNKGAITIQLEAADAGIQFLINNTKKDKNTKEVTGLEIGGIGLENIKKRLALLYPNKHQINIKESDKWYEVQVSLQ